MFKKILNWLTKPNYQSNLDDYITSKHPTTVTEVEYWIQQYDSRTANGY